MQFRYLVFYLILLFCIPFSRIYAQTAGFTVNGKSYSTGDTLYICEGSTVSFISTASGYEKINWVFNNGSPANSTGASPSVLFSTVGQGTALQKVSTGTSADSISIILIVNAKSAALNADFDVSPNSIECASTNYFFTNRSTGSGLSYLWTFGDGDYNTKKDIQHIYTSARGIPGTQSFDVTLTATDAAGCSVKKTQAVTVKKVPDATIDNADASVTKTLFNALTTFSSCNTSYRKGSFYLFKFVNKSASISTNQSYVIKWGDGISPDSSFTTWTAGTVIQHAYPFGLSVMTISIKGPSPDDCVGQQSFNFFVGYAPTIQATPATTEVCEGGVVDFDIAGFEANPPGTVYNAAVDGLITSTRFSPDVSNKVALNFSKSSCGQSNNAWVANFSAVNPCGRAQVSPSIAVSKKAKAVLSLSPAATNVCVGATVTLNNNTDYGNLIYGMTGSSYNCADARDPRQAWTITPATGVTVTGQKGVFSNGTVSENGSGELSLNFTSPGTYTIKLYISDEKCSLDSITKTICVQGKPKAAFAILASDNSKCFTDTLTFQNLTKAATCGANQYLWTIRYHDSLNCTERKRPVYVSGSNTSAQPAVSLNSPGIYEIKLKASLNSECYDTTVLAWAVKGLPRVLIHAPDSICTDNDIKPLADTNNCYASSAMNYSWRLPGASPDQEEGLTTGYFQYHQPGTYPIILSGSNECGTGTDTVQLLVKNKPVANAGNDTSVCGNAAFKIGINTGNYTYSWYPSSGLSDSTVARPSVSLNFNADTTIVYYVKVSSGTDCAAIDSVTIHYRRTPVLTVTPATPGVCPGGSVKLSASGAQSYVWAPAKGLDNTTTAVVTSTPSDSITYQLTGTGVNGCTATLPVSVQIYPEANAGFLPSKDYIQCGSYSLQNVIHMDSANAGNGNYLWYINSRLLNVDTTGIPPAYTVLVKDTVKLVVQSRFGCKSDSATRIFSVSPAVKAAFDIDKHSGCEPLNIHFTNTGSTGVLKTYQWDFGNGVTSNLEQPGDINFTTAGTGVDTTFYITLTVTDSCSSSIIRDSILVKALPKPTFSIQDARPGCSPDTITFVNTSLGIYDRFNWQLDKGSNFDTQNQSPFTHIYTASTPATFHTVLTGYNSCGVDSSVSDITIAENNIHLSFTPAGNLSGCNPDTMLFNNATTGATFAAFDYGDGVTEQLPVAQQQIKHIYQQAGIYNFVATFSNACNISRDTQVVKVFERPKASFRINNGNRSGSDLVVCDRDSVSVTILEQTGNSNTMNWGDLSDEQIVTTSHLYRNTGYYSIRLKSEMVDNGNVVCSAEDIKKVKIGAVPTAGIIQPTHMIDCFYDNVQLNAWGGVKYSWTPNADITNSNSNAPYVSPKNTTTYYVSITGSSGCVVKDSVTVAVKYTQLQGDKFIAQAFTPNGDGVNDKLHVHLPSLTRMTDLKIFNRWGSMVFQTKNASEGWDGRYKGTPLPTDNYVYLLSIVSDCLPGGTQLVKGNVVLLR